MRKTLFIFLSLFAAASASAGPLRFRTVDQGVFSGITDAREIVARTEAEWETLWAEHTSYQNPPQERPEVDFATQMVVACTLGERVTGGYRIEVSRVRKSRAALVVTVRKTAPAAGDPVPEALTQPYHFVTLRRSALPVRFEYRR
jgi:hypothetical protein